jgi:CheY-like chemotaxis protein
VRYTVLIADDSKLQRVIVKENLKDIYDVAEASGGQECLDLVEHSAGKIDAVLLDIVMPGMDGFEVLRQESGVFQKIPVIVLTMSDRKEDQELAEQLGADGFLLKPVDAKQARLQISRVLRED